MVLALHLLCVSGGLSRREKCGRKCDLTPYKPTIRILIPCTPAFVRAFYIVIQQKVLFNTRFIWGTYCTCFHVPSTLKAWQMDFFVCFPFLSPGSIFCILTAFLLISHIGVICSVPLLFFHRFFLLFFLFVCLPADVWIHISSHCRRSRLFLNEYSTPRNKTCYYSRHYMRAALSIKA